jgi:hypothetical protein
MPHELSSTLSATRSTEPDMSFEWKGVPEGNVLKIEARFGGGHALDNYHFVYVPWRSDKEVPFQSKPSAVIVNGDVRVFWGADDSYAIIFSGNMARGGYSNIIGRPVIVFAYLTHTMAEANDSE